MGVIISVVNAKGGTGKTTCTCNLADALGKAGKSVLVADMDPQGNTTSILSSNGTTIFPPVTMYQLLDPSTELRKITRAEMTQTDYKGVELIPNTDLTNNLEPKIIEDVATGNRQGYHRLREAIRDYAIRNYDFTLCDCPPNMGVFVTCSLVASDFVIVPVKTGSAFSVQGLMQAVDFIKTMKAERNPDLKFLRLLFNCRDRRTAISAAIVDQVKRAFDPEQIFKTEIPQNTAFERAEALRQTVFKYDGSAAGARAYRALAKELIKIVGG